jgi:hypothetical protein
VETSRLLRLTELLVQDLDEWREAVGRAGRVADDVRDAVVVVALVDADDIGRDVGALGGSRDDHLLRAGLDVLAGAGAVDEDSGALHVRVRYATHFSDVSRILHRGGRRDPAVRVQFLLYYLDDDVNAELTPWELERVPAGDDRDGLAVDADGRVVHDLDVGLEGAEHRVVLEEVGRLEWNHAYESVRIRGKASE